MLLFVDYSCVWRKHRPYTDHLTLFASPPSWMKGSIWCLLTASARLIILRAIITRIWRVGGATLRVAIVFTAGGFQGVEGIGWYVVGGVGGLIIVVNRKVNCSRSAFIGVLPVFFHVQSWLNVPRQDWILGWDRCICFLICYIFQVTVVVLLNLDRNSFVSFICSLVFLLLHLG